MAEWPLGLIRSRAARWYGRTVALLARQAGRSGGCMPNDKLDTKKIVKMVHSITRPFRVTSGKGFRLSDVKPSETLSFTSEDKPRAKRALANGIEALAELQDMLYAQDRWSVLLIFQAMDAAGKDGAIK